MNESDQALAARKRARELGRFYRLVLFGIATIIFLGIINLLTDSNSLWVQWPALAIGMGIAFRAWRTFGSNKLFGKEWEARKAAELLGQKPKRELEAEFFEE
jgi:hypothetical protein